MNSSLLSLIGYSLSFHAFLLFGPLKEGPKKYGIQNKKINKKYKI